MVILITSKQRSNQNRQLAKDRQVPVEAIPTGSAIVASQCGFFKFQLRLVDTSLVGCLKCALVH